MFNPYYWHLKEFLERLTGIQNSLEFIVLLIVVVKAHAWMNSHQPLPVKEEEEPDPPRNFTAEQLRYFDGNKDEKTGEDKAVYLSVNGQVFDVSDGRDFYGPDGPYETFAGRECGVALAKMSFDTEHLDDLEGCSKLSPSEKSELEGWIDKFTYYRPYDIKGRLIPDSKLKPLQDRVLTKEDLAKHDGSQEEIPEGYAAAPIYLGAGEKVYDMSFGGIGFYGPQGGYNRFAGKDVSRALAKMSFEPEDIENSSIDDLEEKQQKILADWIKKFEQKYPVVGKLKK